MLRSCPVIQKENKGHACVLCPSLKNQPEKKVPVAHKLQRAHKHTNTHSLTQTHSLTHTHTLTHPLTHTHTHTHSLTNTHSLKHNHTHTLTHTNTLTHSNTTTRIPTHSLTHQWVANWEQKKSTNAGIRCQQSPFILATGKKRGVRLHNPQGTANWHTQCEMMQG